MPLEIRPATPADYPRLCEIVNEVEPEHLQTVADMLEADRQRDDAYLYGSFVAVMHGQVVAGADYSQAPGMFHPRKFWLGMGTPRSTWDVGARDALYVHLRATLEPHDPIALFTSTRENRPHEIAWLEAQGFTEKQRTWENHLHLENFDPIAWTVHLERVERGGYTLKPLSAFEDTPEFREMLYRCWLECRRDVPRPAAATEPSLEQFVKRDFDNPHRLTDGYWVAVAPNGQMVALSAVWKTEETGVLHTGLTGTASGHRRHGLALALKVKSLEWAKSAGNARVVTWNEQGNEAMLAINQRLGFVQRPAWIDYVLQIKEESSA
jgi:GNAT superfamily N-acetyltransferase